MITAIQCVINVESSVLLLVSSSSYTLWLKGGEERLNPCINGTFSSTTATATTTRCHVPGHHSCSTSSSTSMCAHC